MIAMKTVLSWFYQEKQGGFLAQKPAIEKLKITKMETKK